MVLVDANVLLDLLTDDPNWADWSQEAIARSVAEGLAINPIIYAEVGPAYRTEDELAAALADWPLQRLALPYEAAWPASQAFVKYRRQGGTRVSSLPDFFIGAHAEVAGLKLLTRDATRYRTSFPTVALICPE